MTTPVSNEDLLREILITRSLLAETDTTLKSHINTEEPVLVSAKALIETHGNDSDAIRVRVAFVNGWMEREADRKALRRAIIEKTLVATIWAVLIYIAIAIRHDLIDVIRGSTHTGLKP